MSIFTHFDNNLRVAIIGASGGIGAALCDALEDSDQIEQIYRLSRRPIAGGIAINLDDEASIASAAAEIGQDGALDLVINATGLLHDDARGIAPEKTWRHLDPEVMMAVYRDNGIGPALVAKHFLPLMTKSRKSVFAALSARVGSISDNRVGGWHSYRAAKAALNMLIRNFAIEMAYKSPQAIVVGLHPGTVATALSAPFHGMVQHNIFSPAEAAQHLLTVIDGLTPQDSGQQWAWDGTPIPG